MTLTRTLAEHFSGPAAEKQPTSQLHEMKRLLIDYVGVALSGSGTESGQLAAEFVSTMGGVPQATVIGSGSKVPACNAAFANAISQHSIELDDIDEEALFHYAPPVMSATLAVGQQVGASGPKILSSALSGCEMMARLSRATNPALRDRGFHTTPTCGVFGATVASGRLLGLDADMMTSALGLAGAQASGLMEMYGTSMQKRFNPGPAARNGVTSAQMAALGFTGADTILDGPRGFGPAFAGGIEPRALTYGLGDDVPVIVEYKPYSCARPIHNAIDCALEVRPALAGRLDEVESILVERHPMWARYHDINEPRTYHEAQVSLPYSVAVALIDGGALPAQYSDNRVQKDKQVQGLSERVTIVADDALNRGVSCRMTVRLSSGEVLDSTVDYPLGSTERPMSDDMLIAKSRALATPRIGGERFEAFIAFVMSIEEQPSIDGLFDIIAAG